MSRNLFTKVRNPLVETYKTEVPFGKPSVIREKHTGKP